ncbi:MAG: Lrp/AsnC ligand binding domain-containing protein [Candidatus Thermoplasmatota archaeon]|nr:Lrp/AsnC ligand binding domain-containing protein [Candidatus Thermoplasmatota archaeon]
MIYGFVMVECKTGKEQEIFKQLQGFDFIEEVHPLFGEYDFIMRMKAENPDELASNIITKVRNMDGIIDTKTFLEATFDSDPIE